MGLLFSGNKREKRTFNYTPKYYDKKTDDLRKEKMLNDEDSHVEFSDRFHQKINENRQTKNDSAKKLIIMVAIFDLLIYIMTSIH